jgi:thiamine-monophosphate kinase
MGRPSEDELIAAYFAPLAGPSAFALRDDAAFLPQRPGHETVVTKDMLVAGVHFFERDPPGPIARKSLRVNLSDLAAKGAEPLGFLLGLALPGNWTEPWLKGFAEGLGGDAAVYNCPLLGGDTVRTPGPLTISITAFGAVPAGQMVPRAGAKPGDRLYVSGTRKPDWAASLAQLERAYLVERYLLPQPRLRLMEALRAHAHASMDVSDGLAGDLAKMLRLAGLTAEVSASGMPLSEAARKALAHSPALVETILAGGDDYEIVCAVPPSRCAAFESDAKVAGVPVGAIGTAVPGDAPPVFRDEEGRALAFARPSFQHFQC